jgi:polysaccharide biosynthesis/export protein
VLHSGYNPDTGAYVLLIDGGSAAGIEEGAEYILTTGGNETGILKISGTLPTSATGSFEPYGAATPPRIGAEITLEPLDGPDVTGAATSQAATPGDAADNPLLAQGYKVGPGDVLKIDAFPPGKLPPQTTVRPDSTISLPYIGIVPVGGQTVFQISETLQNLLARDFRRPWAEVSILQYKSMTVKIIGEINTMAWRVSGAGEYPLYSEMKIADFVTSIGGFTNNADLKNVKVSRADGERLTIDLSSAFANPDVKDNITLRGGDMIFMPTLGKSSTIRVIALGRFSKQGVFDLEPNSSGLMDLLISTGGLAADAAVDRIQIVRTVDGKQQMIQADISNLTAGKLAVELSLLDGDIVYVPAKTEKRKTLSQINNFLKDILPSINFLFLLDRVK